MKGGVNWNHPFPLSVRPSVDALLGKMVQSHNCFPFTPIIMKLHTQTPDERRMCTSDCLVQRSKVKVTIYS